MKNNKGKHVLKKEGFFINKKRIASLGGVVLVFAGILSLQACPEDLSNNDTPTPSITYTVEPTDMVSAEPSADITIKPSATPSMKPTPIPTTIPTNEPTVEPSEEPSVVPSEDVTATPTPKPTSRPTSRPTARPTSKPTSKPTPTPSLAPTATPSPKPSLAPTATPSVQPSVTPTATPSSTPTAKPSATPTPSPKPSVTPTPTAKPSVTPTPEPTPTPIHPVHTHNWVEKVSINDNNDGTHTTLKTQTCTKCGETKEISKVKENCTFTVLSYTDTLESIQCSVCGHTTKRGHNLQETEPDENGLVIVTCSNPGCTYYKEKHVHIECKHEFGEIETSIKDNGDGTHTTLKTKTCTKCGEIKTLSSKTEAHSTSVKIDDDARTTSCSICSHVLIEGHDYAEHEYGNGDKELTCNKCGHVKNIYHAPSYSTPQYVDNNDGTHSIISTCSSCTRGTIHEDKITTEGHSYVPIEGTLTERCACGATRTIDIPLPFNMEEDEQTTNMEQPKQTVFIDNDEDKRLKFTL